MPLVVLENAATTPLSKRSHSVGGNAGTARILSSARSPMASLSQTGTADRKSELTLQLHGTTAALCKQTASQIAAAGSKGGSKRKLMPAIDLHLQREAMETRRREKHEEWVSHHQELSRFDLPNSRVRAAGLVCEAWRLEKLHLDHQHVACKALLSAQRVAPEGSPRKMQCESAKHTDCACLRAPIYRQLLPKYRAMNLLQGRFAAEKLEAAVEGLRRTYATDHEMVSELISRYGPEGTRVDPELWMRSIEERRASVDAKWRAIGRAVKREMQSDDKDAFPVVIRNLSIMRIFLEGSQATTYGCDITERARRDEFHRNVLEQLELCGQLFLPAAATS